MPSAKITGRAWSTWIMDHMLAKLAVLTVAASMPRLVHAGRGASLVVDAKARGSAHAPGEAELDHTPLHDQLAPLVLEMGRKIEVGLNSSYQLASREDLLYREMRSGLEKRLHNFEAGARSLKRRIPKEHLRHISTIRQLVDGEGFGSASPMRTLQNSEDEDSGISELESHDSEDQDDLESIPLPPGPAVTTFRDATEERSALADGEYLKQGLEEASLPQPEGKISVTSAHALPVTYRIAPNSAKLLINDVDIDSHLRPDGNLLGHTLRAAEHVEPAEQPLSDIAATGDDSMVSDQENTEVGDEELVSSQAVQSPEASEDRFALAGKVVPFVDDVPEEKPLPESDHKEPVLAVAEELRAEDALPDEAPAIVQRAAGDDSNKNKQADLDGSAVKQHATLAAAASGLEITDAKVPPAGSLVSREGITKSLANVSSQSQDALVSATQVAQKQSSNHTHANFSQLKNTVTTGLNQSAHATLRSQATNKSTVVSASSSVTESKELPSAQNVELDEEALALEESGSIVSGAADV